MTCPTGSWTILLLTDDMRGWCIARLELDSLSCLLKQSPGPVLVLFHIFTMSKV